MRSVMSHLKEVVATLNFYHYYYYFSIGHAAYMTEQCED